MDLNDLNIATDIAASNVARDADKYWPIFERFDAELAKANLRQQKKLISSNVTFNPVNQIL